MGHTDVVVCSFYTADDYYRDHAEKLRKNLADLGVRSELEEIVKAPGEDWADICRRKIAFLGRVCDQHPDARVFWIDVDCRLHDLPAYVRDATADLVGFQRGFSAPSTIGYGNRTRFWEPCFFGIGTSPAARRFVADAVALEATSRLKATDDYFFEESWRTNAPSMSFQVIPSSAVVGRGGAPGVAPFFTFGSSGNVAEFKSKVVQHAQVQGPSRRGSGSRRLALRAAKAAERRLGQRSGRLTHRLRLVADRSGLTHVLTQGSHQPTGSSRHRQGLVNQMVVQGQRGDLEGVRTLASRLNAADVPTAAEAGAQRAAESFAQYALGGGSQDPLTLSWWVRPFPGNFGDWLSPLVLQSVSQRPVTFRSPTAPTTQPHLVMVGSIGRFIGPRSVVVGTGISTEEVELDGRAHYVSVRGPVTADLLRRQGGPAVTSLGDPGVLLSRLLPIERGPHNGRVALVRHFKHAGLPLTLPEDMDELSVLMSHPEEIRSFLEHLAGYRAVVTSAMHVMIACHSYGIPCALVGFRGFEGAVHGSGIKYRDYALGAGLTGDWQPVVVHLDLRRTHVDDLVRQVRIGEDKLDEVEAAVAAGIAAYDERRG
ncbi:polysaccharide pyruvyl transferase family protein [Nocardioides aurantiacus]|uniref:Polysaccharide pyruvyl transferase n=1 Tax=Nocardioides aurantiacus TaxID=86796 RepID=A0A3N2CSZ6_9ACTN|nr:polysaccharide pyruvyl transferase family protein [Nocardioides aurantiacus]ROR90546.1 polysaccharide pyruvyl transferase [Nocardioides aurantiacus]